MVFFVLAKSPHDSAIYRVQMVELGHGFQAVRVLRRDDGYRSR